MKSKTYLIRLMLPTIILFCCSINLKAQISISGIVTNKENGEAIEGAIVSIYPTSDSNVLLGYNITNEKGFYSIDINNQTTSIFLTISMMNYQTVSSSSLKPTSSTKVDFKLEAQATSLKEIIIKEPRIVQRNDTISYRVGSFADATDKTIGDILKKMPGIEVREDGTILYNGKSINKFYIEGLDLLDNRYGLAVNNISYKNVDKVEVLENHQNIKVLQSSTVTDKAAINLKLKESAKEKWVGSAEVSLGVPSFLWNVDGLAMRFTKRNQSLNILKTNNAGINIKNDLLEHTLEDLINGLENDVHLYSPIDLNFNAPPISEQRFYFNRSALASNNSLWKLKNNFQLKSDINFSYDRLENLQQNLTAYYLPDNNQNLKVRENINNIRTNKVLNAKLNLNKNTEHYYLNNTLNIELAANKTNINTTGTQPNREYAKLPTQLFENDFNLVKQFGNRIFKFNSYNRFDYQPQSLNVLYDSINNPVLQQIKQSSIFSHTNISFGTGYKKWHLDFKSGFKINAQVVHSNLSNITQVVPINDSLSNYFHWTRIEFYLKPMLNYKSSQFNLNLELPVRYNITSLNNQINNKTQNNNYVFLSPSAHLQYRLNPLWMLSARFSFVNSLEDISSLNNSYILNNYRNLSIGNSSVTKQMNQNYGIDLSYRNPVESIFANITVSYSPTENSKIISNQFFNAMLIKEKFVYKNPGSTLKLSTKLSKGIDTWRSSATISITYSVSNNQLFQDNQILKNTISSFEINPKFTTSPLKWLAIEYLGSFYGNNLKISGLPSSQPLWRIQQYLQAAFIFNKWSLETGYEYFFNQISTNTSINSLFIDLSIKYQFRKNIEFNLKGTNIFNNSNYAYTVLSDAYITSSQYNVRPLNLFAGIYFLW